jgi:hypothetical protein
MNKISFSAKSFVLNRGKVSYICEAHFRLISPMSIPMNIPPFLQTELQFSNLASGTDV